MSTIIVNTVKSADGTITKKANRFENDSIAGVWVDCLIKECRKNKAYTKESNNLGVFSYYYIGTQYCEQFTHIDRYDNVVFDDGSYGDKLFLVYDNTDGKQYLSGLYGHSHNMMGIVSRYVMCVVNQYGDSYIRKIDSGYAIEEANGKYVRVKIEMFDI